MTFASCTRVRPPSGDPREAYEERPLSETDPPMPATHYGVFKHANEGNARVFFQANGISSVGLRPWTVYGVGAIPASPPTPHSPCAPSPR